MSQYDCAACGTPLTKENGLAFYVSTALGDTVLRVCREGTCEHDAITGHREQPVKRIKERVGKEERLDRERKAAAAAKMAEAERKVRERMAGRG